MQKRKLVKTLAISLGILSICALSPMKNISIANNKIQLQEEASAATTTVTQGGFTFQIDTTANTAKVTASTNTGAIVVPDNVNGVPVVSIDTCAFKNMTSLTTVTLPDSVISISDLAFYGCTNLTNVYMSDNIKSIGGGAFYNCSKLTNLFTSGSITYCKIGSGTDCFLYNDRGASGTITIPDTVSGYTVVGIAGSAFNTVYSINVSLYQMLYNYNLGLINVVLPDTVKYLSASAFNSCNKLQSINIPNGIEYIGDQCFLDTNALAINVDIPSAVNYVGFMAFNTSGITGVTIEGGITHLDSTFGNDTALKNVTLPNTLTSIGDSTFGGCTQLSSIIIPDSVKSIGSMPFNGCTSLTSIYVPDSVTSIGSNSFHNCTALATASVPAALVYDATVFPATTVVTKRNSVVVTPNITLSKTIAENGESDVTATIANTDSSASYYYTLDGTMPSQTNGKLWDGITSINIPAPSIGTSSTVTLNIVGIKSGSANSSTATATVTFKGKITAPILTPSKTDTSNRDTSIAVTVS
ncbi:leucine-rich repeat domain-containing protein [uncultured Clostridium sp.]|uniref:leucine-rich repeat domain-containing protein n=1 Tax=uncultured Clostridium sp. TaxID=59620 RepID=UPI0028EE5C21|nr:leucine-rich repeat domain-containing protein [uncultured Clostridium sp.]